MESSINFESKEINLGKISFFFGIVSFFLTIFIFANLAVVDFEQAYIGKERAKEVVNSIKYKQLLLFFIIPLTLFFNSKIRINQNGSLVFYMLSFIYLTSACLSFYSYNELLKLTN